MKKKINYNYAFLFYDVKENRVNKVFIIYLPCKNNFNFLKAWLLKSLRLFLKVYRNFFDYLVKYY